MVEGKLEDLGDAVPLCIGCIRRLLSGAGISYFSETKEEPTSLPEERFSEVFRAAQALFAAGETDEDVVHPTLVFANELHHNLDFVTAKERLAEAWNDAEAWRQEAQNFAREHPGFVPVKVEGDVLLLELQPTFVHIQNYSTANVAKEVEIRVYPRTRPATPDQVETAYQDALSRAGIPCNVSDRISLDAEFREAVLRIVVKHGMEVSDEAAPKIWQRRSPRFAHPRLVSALFTALYGEPSKGKDGYARHLKTRQRSRPPEMYNLIPACVAFFLREYGGLRQGEVHDLLNLHVLRQWHPQGEIPKMSFDITKYQSRKSQLWDDVVRVKEKLYRTAFLLYN